MLIVWAFLLDAVMGDPRWLPHPVVKIGHLISALEDRLRKPASSSHQLMLVGALLVVIVLAVSFFAAWLFIYGSSLLHPLVGSVVTVLLLATTLAARCLHEAAAAIIVPLRSHDLPAARQAVAMVVGRDTAAMDEHEVARAAVETIAENTVDGVTAPIFYALIGGAPLALLYKAINTMDSMLGYKNDRYLYLGRVAAKLDDVANWLPARLTVPAMLIAAAFLRLNVRTAVCAMWRDSRNHPSPNSGFAEATTAGALGITLGGENRYFGYTTSRPLLWSKGRKPNTDDISSAAILMRVTSAVFLLFGLAVRALVVYMVKG
ncbi:MAG: adenosylcobinamide-phosphate synthase CbiB [Firmicutes bacterium]|nr:adenosylcobinamide-phosphate synthase CbiB [Bacillota bacterium]